MDGHHLRLDLAVLVLLSALGVQFDMPLFIPVKEAEEGGCGFVLVHVLVLTLDKLAPQTVVEAGASIVYNHVIPNTWRDALRYMIDRGEFQLGAVISGFYARTCEPGEEIGAKVAEHAGGWLVIRRARTLTAQVAQIILGQAKELRRLRGVHDLGEGLRFDSRVHLGKEFFGHSYTLRLRAYDRDLLLLTCPWSQCTGQFGTRPHQADG